MARVLVVHDTRPDLYVELFDNDDDRSWDGPCTGCGWTVSEGGTRFNDCAEAVQACIVHLNHQH